VPNVSWLGTLVVSSMKMDVNFDQRQEQFVIFEALLLWAVFPLNPLDPPSQPSTGTTLLPSVPEHCWEGKHYIWMVNGLYSYTVIPLLIAV
jgi:hypothetical protein